MYIHTKGVPKLRFARFESNITEEEKNQVLSPFLFLSLNSFMKIRPKGGLRNNKSDLFNIVF